VLGRCEPGRDGGAVARILMTNTMCVECIMSKTGLNLAPVLGAIGTLEADLRLIRTWGRCLSCLKRNRALMMVDVSSGSWRGSPARYDGPERYDGLRCMKCEKPIPLTLGEYALIRRGQPYHKACAPAADAMR
jgi:hypothetical protein